jgi:hypothetical protein
MVWSSVNFLRSGDVSPSGEPHHVSASQPFAFVSEGGLDHVGEYTTEESDR